MCASRAAPVPSACGRLAGSMDDADRAEADDASDAGDAGDHLERAWEDALASWDDDAAHERFLVIADATGRLVEAGKRYREIRDRDPARRAAAEKRIDALLAKAVAHMMAVEKSEPAKTRSRLEWIALGVSAALIAAALWQLVR